MIIIYYIKIIQIQIILNNIKSNEANINDSFDKKNNSLLYYSSKINYVLYNITKIIWNNLLYSHII